MCAFSLLCPSPRWCVTNRPCVRSFSVNRAWVGVVGGADWIALLSLWRPVCVLLARPLPPFVVGVLVQEFPSPPAPRCVWSGACQSRVMSIDPSSCLARSRARTGSHVKTVLDIFSGLCLRFSNNYRTREHVLHKCGTEPDCTVHICRNTSVPVGSGAEQYGLLSWVMGPTAAPRSCLARGTLSFFNARLSPSPAAASPHAPRAPADGHWGEHAALRSPSFQ